MSWCRWSTICVNNRTSNLYIYEGDDGLCIHVSGSYIVNENDAPMVMKFYELTRENVDEYIARDNVRTQWIDDYAIRKPIGLPYDGQSFYHNNKEDIRLTLEMLKKAGYNFPEYVFDYIEEYEEV